ncbi:unnamed protein product [Trichogramma brassicae]|uniref:Small ribosomal subunit protein mS33 n=1 Tax=Trichogramma brassicae TaxID=86971 RepID=A0A6H5IFG0_9HYME|nr:unnamed protein product [Trichogramma brassicae]
MSKYVNLANLTTNYAKRMNRLSNRIFGEVVKLFSEKPVDKREEIVQYYPRLRESHVLMKHLRWYGLFRDEHQDFKEEYQRLRELRKKSAWKYGEKKKDSTKTLK